MTITIKNSLTYGEVVIRIPIMVSGLTILIFFTSWIRTYKLFIINYI